MVCDLGLTIVLCESTAITPVVSKDERNIRQSIEWEVCVGFSLTTLCEPLLQNPCAKVVLRSEFAKPNNPVVKGEEGGKGLEFDYEVKKD